MTMHHTNAGPDGSITTRQLHALLGGLPVRAAALKELGAKPVHESPNSCYWRLSDVPQICQLLITHLQAVKASHSNPTHP